jgi:hypothetical protein
MPVIKAMWEAKISKIIVPNQLSKKHLQKNKNKKLAMLVHTCHPSKGRKDKIKGLWSRLAWSKSNILPPK